MEFEQTVEIAAPPQRVWEVWAALAAWPSWAPTFRSVDVSDGGEFAKGTRVKLHVEGGPPAVWTITDFQAGVRFTWESNIRGVKSRARHVVAPAAGGTSSTVTLAVEFSGFMAKLFAPMLNARARKNVPSEAAALKRRCEAS